MTVKPILCRKEAIPFGAKRYSLGTAKVYLKRMSVTPQLGCDARVIVRRVLRLSEQAYQL